MKKIAKLIPLMIVPFLLSSCSIISNLFNNIFSRNNNSGSNSSEEEDENKNNPKREWTLMVYMCGSNLESGVGYDGYGVNNPLGLASSDISEMLSVDNQPDDVNIVLECGGAQTWKNSQVREHKSKLSRWHIKNKKLVFDEEQTKASMGKSSTLQSFLEYSIKTYPAEKYGLFMWNHGGALDGCCFDENYSNDSLTADEIALAVKNAKNHSGLNENYKFEFITYDACLMAVDIVADNNAPHFKYMLASQESEAGEGYDYDAWLPSLYKNPKNITTQALLTKIADTFIAEQDLFAEEYPDVAYDQTQSVYDLSKVDNYKTAFNNFAAGLAGIVTTKYEWNNFASIVKDETLVKDYGESEFDIYNATGEKGVLTALADDSTYSSLSNVITDLNAAISELVVYEIHQKDTYGCGLCFAIPAKGNIYKDYFTSQCNFTTWENLCTSYGSFYSGGMGF